MLENAFTKLMTVLVAAVALANTTGTPSPSRASEPSPAASEEGNKAQAIIARAIEAQGGEANLARQKITRMKGTFRRFDDSGQATPSVSWEQLTQMPDRIKNIQKIEVDGQKQSMTIVVKGNQGWVSVDGQVQDINKAMLISMKVDLYADEVSSLLPLKGKKYQLSILPEVMVDGKPAVGVKVTAKGHPEVKLFFDKTNGLLVKRVRRVDDGMGGQETQEEFFSDYKETDKVKLPRKLETYTDGKKIADGNITEVQLLSKIEDKEFDKPSSLDEKPQKETPLTKQEKPADLKWRPTKVAGPTGRYLVLVDASNKGEFLPAAQAMAALHDGEVQRFDPDKLERTLTDLRKTPPGFVVFVLPPEKIDVDLSHAILEMATKVDEDPFVDFEYGFLTGRDGAAALRFVQRIEQAWKRETGDKAALFGSWEGLFLPNSSQMSALKALGLEAKGRYVKTRDTEEKRQKAAQQILSDCKGKDALMFMSHGYPDRMDLCFSAKNLRDWQVDLSPAILFNCACFNGAPGRWFHPKGKGYEDRGVVDRDESVALALLDSGIAGYFAGVDTWHGPLNSQVFYYVTDDGMRLGEAANAMFNRLALELLPDRIHFEPALKRQRGGKDFWVQNQRDNGAAMILYGDPALAPFAKRAKHLLSSRTESVGKDRISVKIEVRSLVEGQPGEDFWILPSNRLFDYYSLRDDPEKSAPHLELYRVIPLPSGSKGVPALQVVSAKSNDKDIPTGKVQLVIEDTPGGRLLHVRVPLQVPLTESLRVMAMAKQGLTVELEGSW